jgi:hypothetical protein
VDIKRTEDDLYEAYIFERHVAPAGISAVKKFLAMQPGVEFVAQFVGAFNLFARVVAPDLGTLQQRIAEDYFEAGIRSDFSLNLTGPKPTAPKRGSPPICALVCCSVDVPDAITFDAQLEDKFNDFLAANRDQFPKGTYASAVINHPDFDVLVDLGEDSIEKVLDLVLQLRTFLGDGARTATAFADLTNNEIRRH